MPLLEKNEHRINKDFHSYKYILMSISFERGEVTIFRFKNLKVLKVKLMNNKWINQSLPSI